jgi:hypothetical protein
MFKEWEQQIHRQWYNNKVIYDGLPPALPLQRWIDFSGWLDQTLSEDIVVVNVLNEALVKCHWNSMCDYNRCCKEEPLV